MNSISLDARMAAVARFVRDGSYLIDVGTDHAYLPCNLILSGKCKGATACDIGSGPLENARKTVELCGLGGKIELVISNGLDSVEPKSECDVVAAGMGGTLICQILSRAGWLKSDNIRLILQPMSHQEDVRRFLAEGGFSIIDEAAVVTASRRYCVIAAQYDNSSYDACEGYFYYGRLIEKQDAASKEFLRHKHRVLTAQYSALKKSRPDGERTALMKKVLEDFNHAWRINHDDDL